MFPTWQDLKEQDLVCRLHGQRMKRELALRKYLNNQQLERLHKAHVLPLV